MLNSRQRAQLRGMANGYEPILHIGKGGIDADVIKQADDALTARELIKARVLETAPATSRQTADALAKSTKSDVVQVIGSVFILYRENKENKKIFLVK
ncbi:MAG: ribosome assembly RNA-binding protein YhbY [Clostridia bacterium]|nr:ribosome assembly RNA-binding protein YhbY [Clostridia bacterium]